MLLLSVVLISLTTCNGQFLGDGFFPIQSRFGQRTNSPFNPIALGASQIPFRRFPSEIPNPIFNLCNRIALRGTMMCMEKFAPMLITLRDQKELCCTFQQTNSCMSHVYDEFKTALELNGCPEDTLTKVNKKFESGLVMSTIKSQCQEFDNEMCKPKNKKNHNDDDVMVGYGIPEPAFNLPPFLMPPVRDEPQPKDEQQPKETEKPEQKPTDKPDLDSDEQANNQPKDEEPSESAQTSTAIPAEEK